ncbi:hypothetical protein ACI3ER_11505 [Bacillus sp. Wb]
MNKFDKNLKAIYHEYDWCYQKFVTEGMNHKEMADEAGVSERAIKKWCVERHRLTNDYRRVHKKLNQEQEDLIIGSLLGDGHITNEKYSPLFIVSHAEDQKDYLYWKYNILKDLCNQEPKRQDSKEKVFGEESFMSQPSYRIHTRVYDDLIRMRDMSRIELVKSLTNFSFSIWMLDDGNRAVSNWSLCLGQIDDELTNVLEKVLKERFDISFYIKKDQRYIEFDAESSRTIDSIILNSIPNDLDIIKNKINEEYIKEKAKYFGIKFKGAELGLRKFCEENKVSYTKARECYFNGIEDGNKIIEMCGVYA